MKKFIGFWVFVLLVVVFLRFRNDVLAGFVLPSAWIFARSLGFAWLTRIRAHPRCLSGLCLTYFDPTLPDLKRTSHFSSDCYTCRPRPPLAATSTLIMSQSTLTFLVSFCLALLGPALLCSERKQQFLRCCLESRLRLCPRCFSKLFSWNGCALHILMPR